jgi:small GTP-binding protein
MNNFNSPTDQEDYHYRFKVIVLGDTKAGKTTFLDSIIINKLALTQSNGKVIESESSEEISERIALQINDNILFKISYWEVPGKERHLKFLNHYCMGAAVAIVLFDTTKNNSLEKAEKILQAIEVCDIPFKYLVANKVKYKFDILFNRLICYLLKSQALQTLFYNKMPKC